MNEPEQQAIIIEEIIVGVAEEVTDDLAPYGQTRDVIVIESITGIIIALIGAYALSSRRKKK